jgi:prepilin-type N-terminal cleavage/methylation domain-containing protein/prepilin-type processing-associated H-X9-DG protein
MHEKRERASQRNLVSGFTLVELLVVIAIIGLLMGILLPVLSRARQQGHRTHCLSNLKQLTVAWKMYAGDNKGRLCSAETEFNDGPYDRYWVADGSYEDANNDIGGTEKAIKDGVLWPYTQMLDVYHCKADRTEHLRSYSISRSMQGHRRNKPYRTLGEIIKPTERIVFIDATGKWKWLVGSFWGNRTVTELGYNSLTTRHSGGFNVSFADNHCEYWSWKKPDYEDYERLVNALANLKIR